MILYEGPSQLDGAPIVVIATGTDRPSSNVKTGPMIQTWILCADEHPQEAITQGLDASICGGCPHRGEQGRGRTCYVQVGRAPTSIWSAYQRGTYERADDLEALGRGRLVRLGAYGDPAAAPTEVWHRLVKHAAGSTGYTHQWAACDQELRRVCMASVDSAAEAALAQAQGWRTFRVRTNDQPLLENEAVCPASAEGGHKLQCSQCLACNGAQGRRGSIAIVVHGTKRIVNDFERVAA